MSEEQFEEFVRKAAAGYREPPPTPREEIWKRIEAARRDPRRPSTPVVDLAARRRLVRRWGTIVLAAAALVTLGIAIGRLSLPAPVETPVIATAPSSDTTSGPNLLHVAAVATLSQVATLFTDYDADRISDDFRANTRNLLSKTRLLLGSPRLSDPQLKQLLEDLELLLVQVARLSRTGQGDERAFIDNGMADRAIRQRLRNAIPAGPAA